MTTYVYLYFHSRSHMKDFFVGSIKTFGFPDYRPMMVVFLFSQSDFCCFYIYLVVVRIAKTLFFVSCCFLLLLFYNKRKFLEKKLQIAVEKFPFIFIVFFPPGNWAGRFSSFLLSCFKKII